MTLDTIVHLFLLYKYPVLVALSFIEGPYAMMASGFLIRLGTLAIIPTYIALSIGDLLGDAAWYAVGYYFGHRFIRRFGKYFDITEEHVESARRFYRTHSNKILMGSKLTAGLGFSLATLIGAGIARIPFSKFMLLNFIGQFAWTAIMLLVGYMFGHLYVVINDTLGRVFIIGLALLTLFLILRAARLAGRRVKKHLTQSDE